MSPSKRRRALLYITALLALVSTAAARSASSPESARALAAQSAPRVILIAAGGLSWQELRQPQGPSLDYFLKSSAVALMNNKRHDAPDQASVWATLGAGRNAAARGPFSLEIDASHGHGRVIGAEALRAANEAAFTQAVPGMLGQLLQEHTVPSALVRINGGSSKAALLMMNQTGALGRVYDLTFDDPAFDQKLSEILTTHWGLVTFAFPRNLRRYASYPLQAGDLEQATEVSAGIDRLLQEILYLCGGQSTIILLAATSPQFDDPHTLAPATVVLRKPGGQPGLLASASTRRKGYISSVDVAPTLLSFFDLPVPVQMSGRPLSIVSHPSPLRLIDSLDIKTALTHRFSRRFIPLFAWVGAALFGLAIAIVLLARKYIYKMSKPISFLLLFCASLPLVLLLLGAFTITSAALFVAGALFLAAACAFFLVIFFPFPENFALLCVFIAVALLADVFAGSRLLQSSILGYDLIDGIRFFGIGNFEAGLLIGAVVLSVALLFEISPALLGKRPQAFANLLFASVAMTIGASFFGANWGQGLAFVITAIAFRVILLPQEDRKSGVFKGLLIFCLAAALFIAADLLRPAAAQSHLGRSLQLVYQQGTGALWPIIARKGLLALGLLDRFPALGFALPMFLAAGLLACARPGRLRLAAAKFPHLNAAIAACAMGGLAASLINDSGLGAGIAIIGLPLVGLGYLLLEAYCENPGN